MTLRTIAQGLQFAEGPVALPDGTVLVVEIGRRTLTRCHPDGRTEIVAETGGGPNGAAMGPDGKVYICNNGGFEFHVDPKTGYHRTIGQAKDYSGGRIERVDLKTGTVEILFTECEGRPLKGPNDLVFDRTGGLWFTDLGKTRERDMDRGGVYFCRPDTGLIREAIFPMVMPNGIGLSPDETTLYVAETEGGRLWAYDIVGEGEVRKHPFPSPNGGRLVACDAGFRRFDSLAVEQGGAICVATLGTGGITVASPATGTFEFHPMPDAYCTNIAFGGPGLRTAFITLGGSGRLVAMEWPRPGLPLNFLNEGANA